MVQPFSRQRRLAFGTAYVLIISIASLYVMEAENTMAIVKKGGTERYLFLEKISRRSKIGMLKGVDCLQNGGSVRQVDRQCPDLPEKSRLKHGIPHAYLVPNELQNKYGSSYLFFLFA